jgi:hypothetical protein
MGHPGAVSGSGARGQDLELSVALQAVGVDDGAAKIFGQFERQGGFAACGRTADNDGRRQRWGIG